MPSSNKAQTKLLKASRKGHAKVSNGSLEGVADEVTANARIEPEGAERRLVEVLKWAGLRLEAEGWLFKRFGCEALRKRTLAC